MILRLACIALLVGVVLPALLGYAASFSISPIVSQEFVIAIEDVTTSVTDSSEPAGAATAPASLQGQTAGVAAGDSEPGCATPEPGSDALDACSGEAGTATEEESIAATAEPAVTPEPEIDAPDKAPTPYDSNPAPYFSLDPAGP